MASVGRDTDRGRLLRKKVDGWHRSVKALER
jgi:hypothetical protein